MAATVKKKSLTESDPNIDTGPWLAGEDASDFTPGTDIDPSVGSNTDAAANVWATVSGTADDDVIVAGCNGDYSGNSGDDHFYAQVSMAGNFDGGSGYDTLFLNRTSEEFIIGSSYQNHADGFTIASYDSDLEMQVEIRNFERVVFSDGSIVTLNHLETSRGTALGDVILSNGLVYGLGGDDFIFGREAEIVYSADGSNFDFAGGIDLIYGGNGDDFIDGSTGHDWIDGGAGNDRLFGNAGSTLLGGDGNDKFFGRGANMTGGTGSDVFYADTGNSVITDFTLGRDQVVVMLSNSFDIKQVGSDAVITFDFGEVVLKNVVANQLSSHDVIFGDPWL